MNNIKEEEVFYLQEKALKTKERYYGKKIYLRGLIEISNYCKRECRYCGINAYNKNVKRYRLSKQEILEIMRRRVIFRCIKIGVKMRKGKKRFLFKGGDDFRSKKNICFQYL